MSRISSAVRFQVQKRASQRCEYCNLPERFSTYGFHVDHIISKKHDGSDELDNLAWVCQECSLHKGSDIAGYDKETSQLVPIFNPRTQIWDDHFELAGDLIKGITPVGRLTVRILQFNQTEQVVIRKTLIKRKRW